VGAWERESVGILVRRIAALLPMAVLMVACASPERARTRGGGLGADTGNRDRMVRMHEGAQPYHDNRCAMRPKECNGPMPVFGATHDKVD
jgi:hypothetical protein